MLVFRSDLGPRCMSPKPKHGFSPRGGGGTSSNQSESEGFATTRLKRKVVVNQDGPSELGGGLGDLAEGLRLTVPPYAQRVLAVFIFDAAGWFWQLLISWPLRTSWRWIRQS